MLKILKTPTSITIADSDNNRLSVMKTSTGIQFATSFADSKNTRTIYDIQKMIKTIILNPTDNRDNYRVRFDKLAKDITTTDSRTFAILLHKLSLQLA